jgi:hypothetical protein
MFLLMPCHDFLSALKPVVNLSNWKNKGPAKDKFEVSIKIQRLLNYHIYKSFSLLGQL